MHSMNPPGTPFLDYPLMLHSSREYECSFNQTWKCEYQQGYWRFWYKADLRYALPTVTFFCAVIAFFAVAHTFQEVMPQAILRSTPVRWITACGRFLSYKAFRIPFLDWNSAPLGVLALAGVGMVYFFSMVLAPRPYYWPSLDWGSSPPLATRSGWLSIACMPFVFATAGKSNFITLLTGISHEKLQVFHRWIAYAFYVTALLHTFPFIVNNIRHGTMVMEWNASLFYWTGVVALLAQTYLTFASFGPLRKLSYEWFKFSHFLAGLVFMLFLFFHCDYTLTSWDYFIATGVLFSLSWLHRQVRIYGEHGFRHRATISLAANGFVCVRVPTKAVWGIGQHFFVRFMSLKLDAYAIHPFTACSLPEPVSLDGTTNSELVFYIRPQGGFTAKLARHAEAHPYSIVRVLLDGPYGGVDMQRLQESARQLVIAGGSGAGWLMPMVIAFLRRLEIAWRNGDDGTDLPSMKLVLATRDLATRQWFEDALSELLSSSGLGKASSSVELELYYTGSRENAKAPKATGQFLHKLDDPEKASETVNAVSVQSSDSEPSSDGMNRVQARYIDSRPDMAALVRAEAAATPSGGQLGVYVCGPLSMQSDVSSVVASEQISICKGAVEREVYLHMEHFSWA